MHLQEFVRYIALHFVRDVRMGSQVRITAERVGNALAGMHQLIPKTYGPRERGRAMCESTLQCIMIYVVPIWLNAMEKHFIGRSFLVCI